MVPSALFKRSALCCALFAQNNYRVRLLPKVIFWVPQRANVDYLQQIWAQ